MVAVVPGSGLLSVMGVTFSFLPIGTHPSANCGSPRCCCAITMFLCLCLPSLKISLVLPAQQTIATLGRCTCGGAACTPGGTCAACTEPVEGNCLTGQEAYGKVLGTVRPFSFFSCSLPSPTLSSAYIVLPCVSMGVAVLDMQSNCCHDHTDTKRVAALYMCSFWSAAGSR